MKKIEKREHENNDTEIPQIRSKSKFLLRSKYMTKSLQTFYLICEAFNVTPDPTICFVLNHPRIELLDLRASFALNNLLPLEHLFVNHNFMQIKVLKFKHIEFGYPGAVVIRNILENCTSIKELVLKYCNLKPRAIGEIGKALEKNKTLLKLKLRGNNLGSKGALVLGESLKLNSTLEFLDISNCNCGYSGIKELRKVDVTRKEKIIQSLSESNLNEKNFIFQRMNPDGKKDGIGTKEGEESQLIIKNETALQIYLQRFMIKGQDTNYVIEEILNAITHGLPFFFFFIPGLVYLLMKAASFDSTIMTLSYLIYGLSLGCMFASSTFLHALFLLKKTSKIFGIIDHCSISILIAGTYTPFCLNSFGHMYMGLFTFLVIWILAFINIYISFKENAKFWKIELVIYLLMGWCIVFILPFIKNILPPYGWIFVAAGGIFYSSGVIFYVWGRNVPYWHILWHIFVFLGSLMMFFCVYFFDKPHGENKLLVLERMVYSFLH